MRMLSDSSYTVWPIERIGDALRHGRPLPDRVVGLTFDDAFEDFETEVLRVLAEFGFGGTLYVPTAHLGDCSGWMTRFAEDRRPVLGVDAIASLPARGITCGSHSHTHPELDRVPPATLESEITRSRAILEEITARPVRSFAYPYGYYSRRVRSAVIRAGYRYACGTGNEAAWSGADLFALPRFIVYAGSGADAVEALLTQPASPPRHWIERAKQMAWRVSRTVGQSDGGRTAADASAKALLPSPGPRSRADSDATPATS